MNPQQPYQPQSANQQPPTMPYNSDAGAPHYAPYTPSQIDYAGQPSQQAYTQTQPNPQSTAYPHQQDQQPAPAAPVQQPYPYANAAQPAQPAQPATTPNTIQPTQQMAQTAYNTYPGYTQQTYQQSPGGQPQSAYSTQQQPPYQNDLQTQPSAAYSDQPSPAQQPPEPSPNNESFSVDYLNEIAPQSPPVQLNNFAVIGLIVGVLALAFGSLAFLNGSQPDYTKEAQATYARIETLQAATKEHQSHLTENELSSMNATLTTSLGSMASELETTMKESKIKTTLTGNEKKKEQAYAEDLTKTLEDAYLTGVLDRVYARQMSYQLNILKSQLQKLKNASGNRKTIKTFYDTNSKTIDAATKSFNDFTSTK